MANSGLIGNLGGNRSPTPRRCVGSKLAVVVGVPGASSGVKPGHRRRRAIKEVTTRPGNRACDDLQTATDSGSEIVILPSDNWCPDNDIPLAAATNARRPEVHWLGECGLRATPWRHSRFANHHRCVDSEPHRVAKRCENISVVAHTTSATSPPRTSRPRTSAFRWTRWYFDPGLPWNQRTAVALDLPCAESAGFEPPKRALPGETVDVERHRRAPLPSTNVLSMHIGLRCRAKIVPLALLTRPDPLFRGRRD